MPIENYGRIMQDAADFALMPTNALLGAQERAMDEARRNEMLRQRQEAIDLDRQQYQSGVQQQADDDAEWDAAYAAKDWGRMARVDPQTTKILWEREQAISPQSGDSIKIGQYNPGDYTPRSWAQFRQTKDPSILVRQYAPPTPPQPILLNTPAYGAGLIDRSTGRPIAQFTTPERERQAGAAAKAAETEAGESVKAKVEANKAKAAGERTYTAFDNAMTAHESALSGTTTGPVSGRVPAVTAAQQKAVTSRAALAPILKQIFRSAGEGVFTDKDQQLLMDMMPDRTLTPEAREFAAQNVRNVVKAKLGIATDATIKIETDDQYEMLPSGVEFIGPDGVTRRKP